MKKQDRLVRQWAIEQSELAWLLKLYSYPIEILDAVVGIIYQNILTIVGGHNLSINAPLRWMNEETLKNILLARQLDDSKINFVNFQHVINPPNHEGIWDYQQIAPYSKEVFLPKSGEIFLKHWMELLAEKWDREGDSEYNPFSLAFLHNHPVIRPEYLSPELSAEFEAAYDLSGSSLDFTDWVKRLGQEAELSVDDQEIIRTQTTDGIGLLILGAEKQDVVNATSIVSFVSAWQVTQNGSRAIPGIMYSDQHMVDREFTNFLYTISEMVRTTANQARMETSFWPAFATHANNERK